MAKMFDLHPTTIHEHLKKRNVRIRSYREAALLAYSKGRGYKHKIPNSSKKMTKKKAYILGVICGDGYLHRTKNDSYQVALQAVDKDFVLEFSNCIKNVYRLEPSFTKIMIKKDNWNDKWQTRICSKEIFYDILEYGMFNTSSWRIPKVIFNSSKKVKCSFIKGFFDSEGCVDKSRKIVGVSTNKIGLKELKNLLFSLDIESNILKRKSKSANRKDLFYLNITCKENIKKYSKFIGFSIKRKMLKLENLLNNYKN